MSPEYAMDGLFSEKSDVFSFGVILLQILSGKGNRVITSEEEHTNLLDYVSAICGWAFLESCIIYNHITWPF